jgi:hypothetical protein
LTFQVAMRMANEAGEAPGSLGATR